MSDGRSLNEIVDDAKKRMDKSIAVFEGELAKVRTGRASTAIVDHIRADYYGTLTPLSQLATVSVPESRTIIIQPWDVSAIAHIEKAIRQSDLGMNPTNDGKVIRIAVPALTQDRRRDIVKQIGKQAEEYRVSLRQIRKDINALVKEVEKDKKLPEDEVKKGLAKIQEITDSYIKKINDVLAKKEKEILEV
ncbi:MAG: ribosome recycling factor [Deltaproteobacteria bacterium]